MTSRRSHAPFVGRTRELQRLQRAWEAAHAGHPQLVLVAGEAGIGKTRLAAEFAARVRADDGIVLLGECLDLREGGLPYGPLRQALRGLRRSAEDDRLAPVRASAGEVLAALLPELDHAAGPAAVAPARVRLFESLLELFQRLADVAPVLLVVEDVHWADHGTLDLVTFLARNLTDAPVLELLTFRDDEVGPDRPLQGFLQGQGSGTVSDHMELARFSEDDVAAQIAEILAEEPAPSMIREVFERSDGNPLFVEELVAHRDSAAPDIPPQLDALLTGRLTGLDATTQHVLRVASVAGHEVSYEVLRTVVDLSETDLRRGLRTAIDARLLRVDADDDVYFFRHALLQEAIRDRLLPSERRPLHRAYAETLTRLHSDEPTMAGAIASHWDRAGVPDLALRAYVDAAEFAERDYAFADAERYLARASELWDEVDDHSALAPLDKVDLLSRAVDAAVLMEEPARGVPFAQAALRELADSDDSSRRARLQAQLARTLWYAGEVDDGLAASEAALALADTTDGAAAANARRASQLVVLGRLSEARDLAAEAIRLADAVGAWRTRLAASITYATAIGRLESVDEGLRLLDEAEAEARRHGIANDILRSYLYRGRVLRAAARWEDARRCYAEGMTEAPKYGMDRRFVWRFQVLAARVLFLQGHWSQAGALIAQARQHGSRAVLPELAIATGDFATADAFLAAKRSKWRSDESGRLQQPELPVELALWRGDPHHALDLCTAALHALDDRDEPMPLARLCTAGLRALADLAARGDTATGSAEMADHLMDVLRRLSAQHPIRDDGYGLELDALCATGAAELSRALRRGDPTPWHAAAAAWERIGLPYPAAYTHLRLAETLFEHGGSKHEAAGLLRSAAATAGELGARPLREAIAAAAQRAGVALDESGPEARPGADGFEAWTTRRGLTAREQQVLRLIADGRSNREIADELYIAESTASVHVSRILRKLSVRTRAEAISMVLTAGVLGPGQPDRATLR